VLFTDEFIPWTNIKLLGVLQYKIYKVLEVGYKKYFETDMSKCNYKAKCNIHRIY